jgi:putative DNA primase/helicase
MTDSQPPMQRPRLIWDDVRATKQETGNQYTFYSSAIECARAGLRVFPIRKLGKEPIVANWKEKATTNERDILEWSRVWPDANVGIACGQGILVTDYDRLEGSTSLFRYVLMGGWAKALPLTPIARTKKGIHIYYRVPVGAKLGNYVGAFPGVEYRTDGGYVVAPYSVHEDNDGTVYSWLEGRGPTTPLADAPPILLLPRVQLKWLVKAVDRIVEGEGRNAAGHWLACQLRDTSVPAPEAQRLFGYFVQVANVVTPRADHAYTTEEALNTLQSTYATKPRPAAGYVDDQQLMPFTDIGNSERLIQWWGQDIRYTPGLGWLRWAETHWEEGPAAVQENAKATASGILKWALALENEEARKAAIAWGLKSSASQRVAAMMSLASSDPRVYRKDSDMDPDAWLFNVSNGTLDLRTGLLRPHRREDNILKHVPIAYDKDAKCPLWLKFLGQITEGDEELEKLLKYAAGYFMTPSVDEQCLFFLYGMGSNGKSTFVEVMTMLLGSYSYRVSSELLMAGRMANPEAPSPVIASMKGIRLVVTSELEEGQRWSESKVKDLTGKDTLSGRHLNKEPINFFPTHKLVVFGNHKPVVRSATRGIWRRMRTIPFNHTFTEDEIIPDFIQLLQQEMSGILNWALEGCLLWQQDGLPMPAAVREATESYRDDMDLIQQFIDEVCDTSNKEAQTLFARLHQAYEQWCQSRGERPLSSVRFGEAITQKGYAGFKRSGSMWRKGIDVIGG